MVIDTVAGEEEVIKRSIKLLKEKGIDISEEEMKDIYTSTHKYIDHSLKTKEYVSVNLSSLGTAYYLRKSLSRNMSNSKGETKDFWRGKRDMIDIHVFDKNLDRLKAGLGKGTVVHTMQTFKDRNNRWGYPIEKIEEIQNKI